MEQPQTVLTEDIAADVNVICGTTYTLDDLQGGVPCFSTVLFGLQVCDSCFVQPACAVYRAERLGLDIRNMLGPPGTPICQEAKELVMNALEPMVTSGYVAVEDEMPPFEPVVVVSTTEVPPFEPVPASTVIEAPMPPTSLIPVIPEDGTAPADFLTTEDRERLIAIALAVGYTREDIGRRRVPRIRELILEKRLDWSPECRDTVVVIDDGITNSAEGGNTLFPENLFPKPPLVDIEELERVNTIAEVSRRVWDLLSFSKETLPKTRECALVLTKLQEAKMWCREALTEDVKDGEKA